ncbi:hypothetical protein [Streptomyces noursei]|uniref:hypothetical protein n=1 Tax=Streptomyces noursei TaxID=1971 RepID=UPI001F033D50|nr:hypothetical protein [Streptomyces noursei]
MLTSLIGFTVVAVLLTVSPGPDFAVVLRTALGSGRRAALCRALGQRPRVRRRLDQATGGVLVALGAAVGWEVAR